MEVEIRRRQQTFIVFGIWAIIKIVLQLYLNPINWTQLFAEAGLDEPDFFNTLFYVVLVSMIILSVFFRLYIGLSAIGEGKGEKKRRTYLIVALAYVMIVVASYFQTPDSQRYSSEGIATSIIFDVTSSISLVAIILNSYKLRKLRE